MKRGKIRGLLRERGCKERNRCKRGCNQEIVSYEVVNREGRREEEESRGRRKNKKERNYVVMELRDKENKNRKKERKEESKRS